MKTTFFSLFLMAATTATTAQTRHATTLTEDWQFSHDKQTWQTVSVPHDWAIAGPFDKKWDLQMVAIEQNGEKEATEKSGRSGALPWIGKGHYKRTITIPANCKHAELLFDGAMAEPRVNINGQEAGYWAYGYNTFRVDITPFIKAGENLVEVNLQNVEESSRWYPGAGIYRPVTLITTGDDWIDPWKTFIRTTELSHDKAIVDVTIGSGNPLDAQLGFEVELRDAKVPSLGRPNRLICIQPTSNTCRTENSSTPSPRSSASVLSRSLRRVVSNSMASPVRSRGSVSTTTLVHSVPPSTRLPSSARSKR